MKSVVFSLRLTLVVACAGPIAAAIHGEKPPAAAPGGEAALAVFAADSLAAATRRYTAFLCGDSAKAIFVREGFALRPTLETR
jgi:hypothetical protein